MLHSGLYFLDALHPIAMGVVMILGIVIVIKLIITVESVMTVQDVSVRVVAVVGPEKRSETSGFGFPETLYQKRYRIRDKTISPFPTVIGQGNRHPILSISSVDHTAIRT